MEKEQSAIGKITYEKMSGYVDGLIVRKNLDIVFPVIGTVLFYTDGLVHSNVVKNTQKIYDASYILRGEYDDSNLTNLTSCSLVIDHIPEPDEWDAIQMAINMMKSHSKKK